MTRDIDTGIMTVSPSVCLSVRNVPVLDKTAWHIVIVFCLSKAMHEQNINLPVCVCVSLTLSVNLPTGQRIFTVDSLKDVDLREDVPFGGLDDE